MPERNSAKLLALCHETDIAENTSREFEVAQTSIFAVRTAEHLAIYLNRCPHLGIELNWQPDQFLDYDQEWIQCSTHGALFAIASGECVAGPCSGESLQAIPYQLKDGTIYLDPTVVANLAR